ncbi:MAG: hypothetical protein ACI8VW_000541 [bacterium]|jgi:hypothetical protein
MTDIKRRKFVTFLSAGAAVVPLSALITSLPGHAADMPLVDVSSAQAKALQYVEVTPYEGKMCSNCALYSGADDAEMGGCPLFPGASVAADGWCSAYVPKG